LLQHCSCFQRRTNLDTHVISAAEPTKKPAISLHI